MYLRAWVRTLSFFNDARSSLPWSTLRQRLSFYSGSKYLKVLGRIQYTVGNWISGEDLGGKSYKTDTRLLSMTSMGRGCQPFLFDVCQATWSMAAKRVREREYVSSWLNVYMSSSNVRLMGCGLCLFCLHPIVLTFPLYRTLLLLTSPIVSHLICHLNV